MNSTAEWIIHSSKALILGFAALFAVMVLIGLLVVGTGGILGAMGFDDPLLAFGLIGVVGLIGLVAFLYYAFAHL